jgi:hypothetical protein
MPTSKEEPVAICPYCKQQNGQQTKVVVEKNGQLARHKRPGYLAWRDPSCQELRAAESKADKSGSTIPILDKDTAGPKSRARKQQAA